MDIGTGFTGATWTPSLTYFQTLTMAKAPWLGIGWTGHFSGTFIGDKPVLNTLGNPRREDSMELNRIGIYSAAFGLTLSLNFDKVELGANVDLLGLSFGKMVKGLYLIADTTAASDSSVRYHNTHIDVFPQGTSALPVLWKKNNGQSQVFLRFWINQEFGVKLGYMISNISYASEQKLNNGHNRFITEYGMPFATISFKIPN